MRKLQDFTHIFLSVTLILSFSLAPLQGAIQPAQAARYMEGEDGETTPTPIFYETVVPATPEATLAPRPSATPTPFETSEPTNPTPTAFPAPTEISLPTSTPTSAISPTPPGIVDPFTPTPTPEDIATQAPSPSPTMTIAETLPITFTLQTDSQAIKPGEVINFLWESELAELAENPLEIQLTLPSGVQPFDPARGFFDPLSSIYTIQVTDLTGQFGIQVDPEAIGPFSFKAGLYLKDSLLKEFSLVIEDEGLNLIPIEGGVAAGLNNQVKVIFPPEALREALYVRVRQPAKDSLPPDSLSEEPFELLAISQNSRDVVETFDTQLTIEVDYSLPFNGTVYYFDADENDWKPLPTEYDRRNGVLRATTTHFSIFDTNVNDWTAAQMPNVDSAQTFTQTGAATYSYPFWTPPGPAGLQPSLSLSYNSQIVDSSVAGISQAGWVGMGWSLDVGYIDRNYNGTDWETDDDTYSLVINGVSSAVVPAADGSYHLASENFWKIAPYGIGWKVWDKVGNQYVFGDTAATQAQYAEYHPCYYHDDPDDGVWRYALSKTINQFGKEITYSYTKET